MIVESTRYRIEPDPLTSTVSITVSVATNPSTILLLVAFGVAAGFGLRFLALLLLELHVSLAMPVAIAVAILAATFLVVSIGWHACGRESYRFPSAGAPSTTNVMTYRWSALCVGRTQVFSIAHMKPLQPMAPPDRCTLAPRPTFGFLYNGGRHMGLGFALDHGEVRAFLHDLAPHVPESIAPFQLSPTKIQDQLMESPTTLARRKSNPGIASSSDMGRIELSIVVDEPGHVDDGKDTRRNMLS
ncbi:Aste57867_2642 [Aphanomyces stellatus]|uniref:Aste57867_2642 protein n=1 Tax=Aphanomyces stellatus TaxID=120398 RepID=A0A485K9N3_9STRA|nr:hypothetical protein As57867_002635 [Aphanomyces stellatus]VFT79838.1 Aste57867_2642 [Aphanomyces stellatus]